MPVPNNSYPTVFHVEITHNAASQTIEIPVQAGTYIPSRGVSVVVPTAFTTSDANASLLIGVTGDTDALMKATSTALQTQSDAGGTEPKIASNSEDNLNGYLFMQDGKLLLTFTAANAGATAGRAIVQVMLGVATLDGIDF
jgi:hypothetical protein